MAVSLAKGVGGVESFRDLILIASFLMNIILFIRELRDPKK